MPADLAGRVQGVAYERASDAFRVDRVQGLSLGLGYRLLLSRGGLAYVHGTVRYGFSDERITGKLSVVWDASPGRLGVSGYRDIVNVDPFAVGQTIGNTLNAIFVAHDDADYALAEGGSAGYEASVAPGIELALWGRIERQRTVARQASATINDWLGGRGVFPDNAPVDEGTFGGLGARVAGLGRARWWFAVDALAGAGTTVARAYGELRAEAGERSGATLRLKGGIATTPTLRQMEFRLGGIRTVRGFDYGVRRGQAFWAAQLDATPIRGRLRPVMFVDVGQAGAARDLFETDALVGAGIGVSMFEGALRLDLSRRLSPGDGTLRFDIAVGAVR